MTQTSVLVIFFFEFIAIKKLLITGMGECLSSSRQPYKLWQHTTHPPIPDLMVWSTVPQLSELPKNRDQPVWTRPGHWVGFPLGVTSTAGIYKESMFTRDITRTNPPCFTWTITAALLGNYKGTNHAQQLSSMYAVTTCSASHRPGTGRIYIQIGTCPLGLRGLLVGNRTAPLGPR